MEERMKKILYTVYKLWSFPSRKMKCFSAVAFLVFTFTNVKALGDCLLESQHSIFSRLDREGHASVWVGPEYDIKGGRDLNLNLRMNFTSGSIFISEPILGNSWWFPLFESSLAQSSEDSLVVKLPDGGRSILSRVGSNKLASTCGSWTGTYSGNSATLTNREGWELRYLDGRLRSASGPNGISIVWPFENGKPSGLQIGERKVIDLKYSPRTRLLEKLVLLDDGVEMRFDSEDVPIYVDAAGGRQIIGAMVKSVSLIEAPELSCRVTRQLSSEDGLLSVKFHDGTKGGEGQVLSIGADTGFLVMDDVFDYTVYAPGDRETVVRRRGRTDGAAEEVVFDDKRFLRHHVLSSGNRVTSQFAKVGKLTKIRSVILRNSDGNVTQKTQRLYNVDGELLREVTERPGDGNVSKTVCVNAALINEKIESLGTLKSLFE